MKAKPWHLHEISRNVHQLTMMMAGPAWQQDVLLLSDLHWDNPKCDRKLLARHLDQAVERNAPIIILGDVLCCMQGKADGRHTKGDVRPEHQVDSYFDSIVETAADWFAPYRHHLAVLGQGNHESAIVKRQETNLLDRIAMLLRHRGGITRATGYGFFVKFKADGNFNASQVLYAHHGYGGGGITQQASAWPKYMTQVRADIYAAGHIHSKEVKPLKIARLNHRGKVEQNTIHVIRCGTYKDEWIDGHGGWHVEKGQGPRPLGGYWLRFSRQDRRLCREVLEAN